MEDKVEESMHAMLRKLVHRGGPLYDTYWMEPRSPEEQVLREVWGGHGWNEPVPAIWDIALLARQVLEKD